MNTASFLSIPASMFGDQEILVFGPHRRCYGELLSRVRRLAASMRQAGIGKGDVVAALQTNSDTYLETYYASATLGAVFVPLNYRAKPPELEYAIATAKTKMIFVGDRYADLFEALRPKLPSIASIVAYESGDSGWLRYEELLENQEEVEDADVEESDVSILMYTSGTTSLPKGVLLTHGDFTAYVTNTTELADGSDRGTALVSVPFYHIAGTAQMMTTMWSGRRLVIRPQFQATEWLETVAARARHARDGRADDAQADRRSSRPREVQSVDAHESLVRRRADAAARDPPRDRAAAEDDRLRQRLRSDRDHFHADDPRSRRSSAGGSARRGRKEGAPAGLDRQAASRRRVPGRGRRRQPAAGGRSRRDRDSYGADHEGLRDRKRRGDEPARGRMAPHPRHGLGRRRRLHLPRRAARTT